MSKAVVFAYHNVGVRCLSVLLAHGVDVKLVVTHRDNPKETIWFDSVAELAALHGIPTITPDNPNTPEVVAQIRALHPDFFFSFYYREMLKRELLEIPWRGALNMHGSLLPKYRGRVPVNWAIIHGETETGATLHYMTEKPDNGNIVAQQAVPILPNDTALQVFQKVTVAAEMALNAVLPDLLAGRAKAVAQDLGKGEYFGGRKAEDGIIDWSQSAPADTQPGARGGAALSGRNDAVDGQADARITDIGNWADAGGSGQNWRQACVLCQGRQGLCDLRAGRAARGALRAGRYRNECSGICREVWSGKI